MLIYELYNPLNSTSLGFYSTEIECHKTADAKGLINYEIVTCESSFKELVRIVTVSYSIEIKG
jgi:hypothetical protein